MDCFYFFFFCKQRNEREKNSTRLSEHKACVRVRSGLDKRKTENKKEKTHLREKKHRANFVGYKMAASKRMEMQFPERKF